MITQAIHKDKLQAQSIIAKIIYQCITLLHELWLQQCHIIHIKSDGVEIEEKVELINKLKQTRTNENLPLSL